MARKTAEAPRYAAPALDKGLDILELLASRSAGLGQSEIARALGRTSGEIFRMVSRLEERGYIRRGGAGDRYRLTPKLFELAHQHPPTKRLLQIALPEMYALTERVEQSCHLAIRHEDRALIVGQADGPGFLGFAVRVGAQIGLTESASGIVLLAFQPEAVRSAWLHGVPVGRALQEALAAAARKGYHEQPSTVTKGITDVSCPVREHDGTAAAALTIPFLKMLKGGKDLDDARELLAAAAGRISLGLGGAS